MAQNSREGITPQRTAEAIQEVETRGQHMMAQYGANPMDVKTPKTVPYKKFLKRHASYRADLWARLRALYAGGHELLENQSLLRDIFPKHKGEVDAIYEERLARASYIPYAGEIVNHLISQLFRQLITMTTEEVEGTESEDTAPDFYDSFYKDCSPEGGDEQTFNQLMRETILTALICGTAWTRIDMPDVRDDEGNQAVFADAGAEEESGILSAYALNQEPETVLNWKTEENGELRWVLLGVEVDPQMDFLDDDSMIIKRFTLIDSANWQRFEIRHKKGEEPKENDQVHIVAEGVHSFGRVPLVRFELPKALWAMDKLESLARSLFCSYNALDWACIQSLFQELYEFLGPEDPMGEEISEHQEIVERAFNQVRGTGYVQTRGADDKAMYIGPDTGSFQFALDFGKSKRDEMHRVTNQMALTVDPSAGSVGRSGASKREDKSDRTVVLGEFGRFMRSHAENCYGMVSLGRMEEELSKQWSARGMEKYEDVDIDNTVERNVQVEAINLPSATFHKRRLFALAKLMLGEEATPEDIEDIEKELEENITPEQFEPGPSPEEMMMLMQGEDGEGGDEELDEGRIVEEDDELMAGRLV